MPQWGMNMEEGQLVSWLVEEGDSVREGQPLVEVETAKINSELESPVSGVVAHVMVPEGTTVEVGTIVAVIAEPGESPPRPADTAPPRSPAASRQAAPTPATTSPDRRQVTPVARRLAQQSGIALEQVIGTGPGGRVTEGDVREAISTRDSGGAVRRVQVVPRARLLAKERGIDLNLVQGSGPNGRITVADVGTAISGPAQTEGHVVQAPPVPASEVLPLSGLRKIIADRMMHSVLSTAPVTLTTEADVTEAVRLTEDLLTRWRPQRIRPMHQDLIVKAVAVALRAHPRLNAMLVNDEINILEEVNVGVAMAVTDGLMVPVVRHADDKDLLTIAREIRELADRARKGTLSVDDVTGATFTITSLASYDVDAFTPIIDAPQVAILGLGRVVEKAAVHEGELAVRSMLSLSLTFDHRALDGVPAGAFLKDLKSRLEDPVWLSDA